MVTDTLYESESKELEDTLISIIRSANLPEKRTIQDDLAELGFDVTRRHERKPIEEDGDYSLASAIGRLEGNGLPFRMRDLVAMELSLAYAAGVMKGAKA